MSLQAIITAVAAILDGVEVAGRVYPYQLYANTDQKFPLFFATNGVIDTAMVTRGSTQAQDEGPNNQFDYHLVVIDKYRAASWADDGTSASETQFQLDVETIRATFNANRKLTVNNVHNAPSLAGPMSAAEVHYVMFGGALCHHAKLTVKVKDGPNSTQSA